MKSNIMQILKEYHGCAENCKGCIDKTERILALLRENIPAEKDVKELYYGNAQNSRNQGWNAYRQSLLQALLGKER